MAGTVGNCKGKKFTNKFNFISIDTALAEPIKIQ